MEKKEKVDRTAICGACKTTISWVKKKGTDGLVPMCRNEKCKLCYCFDVNDARREEVKA